MRHLPRPGDIPLCGKRHAGRRAHRQGLDRRKQLRRARRGGPRLFQGERAAGALGAGRPLRLADQAAGGPGRRNIDVKIEFSWGATEAKVVSGLADAIVEVTETESTIKAHGLRILHELMQTNTQLIVNHEAWKDAAKRRKVEQIALLLKGALLGAKMSGLKMNVPEERMEEVIGLLPSLKAPTVAPLYRSKYFSVETVVSRETVRDLIPRLLAHGAEGIIEYPLNKVV
jgi:ATP phosphoribosyltransferase-like protein